MNLNEYLKLAGVERPLAFGDYVEIKLPDANGGLSGVPRDYQVTGLHLSLKNHWYGLWDDPGTGKTVVSQAWAIYWATEGYRTIVLTLSNLIGQYMDDFFETFEGIEKFMTVDRFNYEPKKRRVLEEGWDQNGWPQMLVMTYEGFSNLFKAKCPTADPAWFYERGYRVMCADEVHKKLCNVDTKLWKQIKAWRDNAQVEPLRPPNNETVFLPMTGTPIPRTLTDAYGIIELVNPGRYVGFKHFDREHSQYKTVKLSPENYITAKGGKVIKQIKQLIGYRNHDKVHKLLYEKGRRVVKDQVLDLHKPNIRRVKVTLSDEHYLLYHRLLKERFLEMGNEVILAMNQQQLRQHALQMVSCPELFLSEEDQVGFRNAVMEAVLDWLEEADLESQKVILFFNRIDSIERYGAALSQYNPAFMYGEVQGSAKEKQRQKILHDDSCRLLIANPRSASAGLNLQNQSHNVLFVEPTGVYGDFKQGLERVLRSGQKHVVDVGVIDALRTVSRKAIQNMLTAEMDIERAVVDKTRLLADLVLS